MSIHTDTTNAIQAVTTAKATAQAVVDQLSATLTALEATALLVNVPSAPPA